MERKNFVCSCHSLEHQLFFWYDTECKELYCEPHFITHRNFFKRLIYGLKYAFGYKTKYGNFDSMIFKDEDLIKLKNHLDNIQ